MVNSERREWHGCLLWAGLLLAVPAILGLFQARDASVGWLSPIHAVVLGGSVSLLAAAFAGRHGRELHACKQSGLVAYGLLACGMLIFVLGSIGLPVPSEVFIAAGFGVGVGKALAFLLWARLFSSLPLSSMLLHSSAACLVAGLAGWLLMGLRFEWKAVIAVAAPLIVGVAYRCSCATLPSHPSSTEGQLRDQERGHLPWRPIIIMALVGFVAALGPIATFGIIVALEAAALMPVGALALGALLWMKAFRSEFLLKASFAIYGLGFLILLFFAQCSMAAGFLVSMSYWGMALFVFWFLCNEAHERAFSVSWTFGISFALLDVMQLFGYALPQLGLAVPTANEGGALGVFAVAALALAIAGAALWASEHVGQGHWARRQVGVDMPCAAKAGESELAFRCRMSGQAHGLTLREEEILVLLLERNTIDQIAHRLFVSGNTVKTHVKHIYGKMGVHNRDELRKAVLGS